MKPVEPFLVQQIDWPEVIPGLILLRSARLARQLGKLLLGALGLVLTAVGWIALGVLFAGDPQVETFSRHYTYQGWPRALSAERAPPAPEGVLQGTFLDAARFVGVPLHDAQDRAWFGLNPWLETWELISRPARQFWQAGTSLHACAYLLLLALWSLLVWSLCGGAIARIAALQLTRDEGLGVRGSLRYATRHFSAFAWAPALPLWLLLAAAAGFSALTWLLRSDAGLLALAVLMPVALVMGLGLVIVLVGLAAGWPLMWGATATEGADGFDAISRSYAYVWQRPLQYAIYVALAIVYGMLAWLLVATLAATLAWLLSWLAMWGAGAAQLAEIHAALPDDVLIVGHATAGSTADVTATAAPSSGLRHIGLTLVACWLGVVKLLALGFGPSYFFTSTTAIYLLLRRHADATEMTEVHLEAAPAPAPSPLGRDSVGVPLAAEPASGPQAVNSASPESASAATAAPPADSADVADDTRLTASARMRADLVPPPKVSPDAHIPPDERNLEDGG